MQPEELLACYRWIMASLIIILLAEAACSPCQPPPARAAGIASPVGARSPPGGPSSPRQGECTVGSAPSRLSKLFQFDSLLHEGGGDAIDTKERWFERFDSSSLNAAPEETDMSVWRHGSFKLADPVHCLHYNEARREAGLEPVPCTEPGAAPPPQA